MKMNFLGHKQKKDWKMENHFLQKMKKAENDQMAHFHQQKQISFGLYLLTLCTPI